MSKIGTHNPNSVWQSLVAGGIAGSVDTCFTMPLDTVKTQMQLRAYPSTIGCIRHIVDKGGVIGLYSGFKPFLVQASGKSAVRFFAFGGFCSMLDSIGVDRSLNSGMWSGICGFGAGMVEALLWTTPSERLKVLQQAAVAEGKRPTVTQLMKQTGILGLYVGALPTALRQASGVAIRFTTHEKVKHFFSHTYLDENGKPKISNSLSSFLGGGIGGAVSVVANNPIDVLKSKIQAGYKGGMLACARDLYKTRGLKVFASGLSVRVPRLFMSQAIQFMMYDEIIALIQTLSK
eukprot:c4322_g1_i1.p1 GENE.c4322_g1_i1~~c4322_g1_i1.p1  ORF type:complete len:290 (+),score=58.36 c4322_g1_i1:301-1170(+)